MIKKQEYIIYLSQENSSISHTNENSSRKLLAEIQDQKDAINGLKKLNLRQKGMVEEEKERVQEKGGKVASLH